MPATVTNETKLKLVGLSVAILSLIATFVVPEIRSLLKLESNETIKNDKVVDEIHNVEEEGNVLRSPDNQLALEEREHSLRLGRLIDGRYRWKNYNIESTSTETIEVWEFGGGNSGPMFIYEPHRNSEWISADTFRLRFLGASAIDTFKLDGDGYYDIKVDPLAYIISVLKVGSSDHFGDGDTD